MDQEKEYTWDVKKVIKETDNIITLVLDTEDKRPDFIAGQYLTVKLPGHNPTEGKAYSISSPPYKKLLTLTIENNGGFSSILTKLKVGDQIKTSPPFGFFYPEDEDEDSLVFIVSGIGITPCISILEDLFENQTKCSAYLFYSNKTKNDIVFQNRLDGLSKYNNFKYQHNITREENLKEPFVSGRINIKNILSKLPSPNQSTFFICGGISFTRDMWKELQKEIGRAHV